jgi:hypothetical protein
VNGLESVSVKDNDETYSNCNVCHARKDGASFTRLLDIHLPQMRLTLCEECCGLLSEKLKEI